MTRRDRRPRRGRWLTLLGALALSLLLAEGALRLFLPLPDLSAVFAAVDDPELLYETVPGAAHRFEMPAPDATVPRPATITIDAEGGRLMPAGDSDCPELWVAGDSYAFGWGVGDAETYTALLQQDARRTLGCLPPITNLAVGGYHMGQIAARVRAFVQRRGRRPDLLVIHTADNDGIGDINWASPLGLPRALSRRVHLLQVLNLLAVSHLYNRLEGAPGAPARLTARLNALLSWTQAQGIPVWTLWQPFVPREAREAARPRLLGEQDLEPCNRSPAMHLSEEDDHYSAAGHRCIADLIGPDLIAALAAAR